MTLEELRDLSDAATPGPWEVGDPWLIAGILANRFGKDRCAYCSDRGALHGPPVWSGRRDINGTKMQAHVHRSAEPWDEGHRISGPLNNGNPLGVAGNYDDEQGGILDPTDAAFIVAAVNWVREQLGEGPL